MKRFIDDHIWLDHWFSKLDSNEKLIWIYLFTNCSRIGLWEENKQEVEYRLKKKIDWEKVKKDFSEKVYFFENKWHIKKFIEIQYPKLLIKPESPLHISVFDELERCGLILKGNSLYIDYESILIVLRKGKEEEEVRNGIGNGKVLEEVRKDEISWKTNFDQYNICADIALNTLLKDVAYISEREGYHPGLDIPLSIKKAFNDFWKKEAGWKNKKAASRSNPNYEIDWKDTINHALSMKCNQVWKSNKPQMGTHVFGD